MRALNTSLHLSIHIYNLFNTMAFEGRVSASMVHICIIRLILNQWHAESSIYTFMDYDILGEEDDQEDMSRECTFDLNSDLIV